MPKIASLYERFCYSYNFVFLKLKYCGIVKFDLLFPNKCLLFYWYIKSNLDRMLQLLQTVSTRNLVLFWQQHIMIPWNKSRHLLQPILSAVAISKNCSEYKSKGLLLNNCNLSTSSNIGCKNLFAHNLKRTSYQAFSLITWNEQVIKPSRS